MTCFFGFFCCCLFHFHKETLIHSETNPQFLLVRPECATSPTSVSLLFSTPAGRCQADSSDALRGVTPRKRVQVFLLVGTPGSGRAPLHTSPLAHPRWLPAAGLGTAGALGQLCNGTVFSTYAGEEYVHYCRRTQAHVLTYLCVRVHCGSFWLCILCSGESCYIPKMNRGSLYS